MKNLFKIIFLIFLTTSVAKADYQVATITPTTYKVTVEKVELCETGSTQALCLNPVVLGTGSQEMDIAAVDVGATAGSYGNPAKMIPGKTYTYIQSTLNRAMTMSADAILASGRVCATGGASSSAGSKSAFANGQGSTSDNLTPAEQVIYIADESATHAVAGITTAGAEGNGTVEIAMGTDLTGIVTVDGTGTAGVVGTSHQYVQHRVLLTTPFTVGLLTPNVDIAFGVTNALYAYWTNDLNNDNSTGDLDCAFWAGEPSVSVTFK